MTPLGPSARECCCSGGGMEWVSVCVCVCVCDLLEGEREEGGEMGVQMLIIVCLS